MGIIRIIAFIKRLLRDRKAKKILKKIEIFIQEIDSTREQFSQDISALKFRRSFITDEEIQEIEGKYDSAYQYFFHGNLFNVNQDILTYMEQIDGEVRIMNTSLYKEVSQLYDKVRQDFIILHFKLIKKQEEINAAIKNYTVTANSFHTEVNELRKCYIAHSQYQQLILSYKDAYDFFFPHIEDIKDDSVYQFVHSYHHLETLIDAWNESYTFQELQTHKKLFDNIDGKSLDDQQRHAVVIDDDNNLVLAGAGSGKTLTISAKVKYLVDTKGIHPKDILLISFTNKSAAEMYDRISNKLGIKNVNSKTFHRLGKEIISEARQVSPDVFERNKLQKLIETYIEKNLWYDGVQIKNIIEFFAYYLTISKDISEFENLGDYYEYHKNVDFKTLKDRMSNSEFISQASKELAGQKQTIKGDKVKSYEEILIANFLFLNGITYHYEYDYPINTANQFYRQYKPDFYLPEYDLYIEHFGVNENMRAPWLNAFEEQKYINGMEWKKEVHQRNQTTHIESFSYYNKQGILLEKLKENLLKHGVSFREPDFQEIFSAIYKQQNGYMTNFVSLIISFINLFKSNGYRTEDLDRLAEENRNRTSHLFLKRRMEIFLSIVKPIYLHYEQKLRQIGDIDFNDMINLATEIVDQGKVDLNYKYIIIDEYQDISKSRSLLIQKIKEKTNAKIMCVGDDWQSIYRFAGSDLNLFTKFDEFFGKYKLIKIENTYRNSQELINIAGRFIMENPHQFTKNLKSNKSRTNPIQIFGYIQNQVEAFKKVIDKVVDQNGEDTSIMLIGRNNRDIKFIKEDPEFKKPEDSNIVTYKRYPKLKMEFLSAHRSKGLEETNTIILNGENSILGFPNQITDDPILSCLLTAPDYYVHAEERRLFYVALTRTENTCYIMTPEKRMSVFVKELIEKHSVPYELVTNEKSSKNHPPCPICIKGVLELRRYRNKGLLGCSNYPRCRYITSNTDILKQPIKCQECGGYAVKVNHRYQCTNFPTCSSTKLNIAYSSAIQRRTKI